MRGRIALVILSLVLSVVIGVVLAKSSPQNANVAHDGKRKLKVGLSLDTLKEARWQQDKIMFEAAVAKLGGETFVQAANSDDTRQMQDVQSLITQGVDVLVIAPHNGEAMAKAVELAHEANIPVIAYDRLIMNSDLDLYISFDNLKVGEMQAQYVIDHLPPGKKAKVVRIYGAKTDNNAKLYKEGQDRVLDKAVKDGRIEVIHEDWAENWAPQNAKKIATAALTKHGRGIDVIIASNDGTAGGAVQALIEEGLAGKVLVTGQDAEVAAAQRIIGGTQTMTVYKPIKALASKAAELAMNLAARKPVIAKGSVPNGRLDVPSVFLDVVAVDKNNMKSTVVADGYITEAQLNNQ